MPDSSTPIKITLVSETTFTVRGHGVHTAFIEMKAGLEAHTDTEVAVNRFDDADIRHIHTVGLYSLLHLLIGRGKKVVSVHVIPDSFVGSLVGAKYWYGLAEAYLRFFYSRADLLVAVSGEVAGALKSQLRIRKPTVVIFNTVDREKYRRRPKDRGKARRSLGIDLKAFVVVGSGQVQPRKRYDVFVKLAQENPDILFFWVGGITFKRLGAGHQEMDRLMKLAPANLITTGVLELDEVKRYYQAADAFLLPSEQENHPLAAIEAAAAGLPVIVRDIHEYDSSFGQDVLRGDDLSFGSILQKLKTDGAYRQKAIEMSDKVARRFDNSEGATRLVAKYRELLK